jgi:hypothetical protein
MLILLRIIFTGALVYSLNQARLNGERNLAAGDMDNAFWLAASVLLAIAAAVAWAPFIGEKIADPMTGGLSNSPYKEPKNPFMSLIRWLDSRGSRRAVALLCFIQGVRAPWRPSAFIMGMNAAREGSWLQKVYAREVFRFNNAENCLKAFAILKSHGIDPRPHKNTEINLLLSAGDQAKRPEPQVIKAPQAAPAPKLERDPRIRIGERK